MCGLVFGIIDVLIMIPLKYENNRKRTEAMTAAPIIGIGIVGSVVIGFIVKTII